MDCDLLRLGKAINYSRDGLFKEDKALAIQWIKCAADLGYAEALSKIWETILLAVKDLSMRRVIIL